MNVSADCEPGLPAGGSRPERQIGDLIQVEENGLIFEITHVPGGGVDVYAIVRRAGMLLTRAQTPVHLDVDRPLLFKQEGPFGERYHLRFIMVPPVRTPPDDQIV